MKVRQNKGNVDFDIFLDSADVSSHLSFKLSFLLLKEVIQYVFKCKCRRLHRLHFGKLLQFSPREKLQLFNTLYIIFTCSWIFLFLLLKMLWLFYGCITIKNILYHTRETCNVYINVYLHMSTFICTCGRSVIFFKKNLFLWN